MSNPPQGPPKIDLSEVIKSDIQEYSENENYNNFLSQESQDYGYQIQTLAIYFSAFLDLIKGIHVTIADSTDPSRKFEPVDHLIPIYGTVVFTLEETGKLAKPRFSNQKTVSTFDERYNGRREFDFVWLLTGYEAFDVLSFPTHLRSCIHTEITVHFSWVIWNKTLIGVKKGSIQKLLTRRQASARVRPAENVQNMAGVQSLTKILSIAQQPYIRGGARVNVLTQKNEIFESFTTTYVQRPNGLKAHSHREIYIGNGFYHEPSSGLILDSSGDVVQDIDCSYDEARIAAYVSPRREYSQEKLSGAWLSVGTTNNHLGHFFYESLKRIYLAATQLKFSVLLPHGCGEMIVDIMSVLKRRAVINDFLIALPDRVYIPDRTVYVRDDVRDLNLAELHAINLVHQDDREIFRGEKIYISRSDSTNSRRLLNESEVEHLVTLRGHRVIRFSDYTFEEKVGIMKGVRGVSGPAGAAFCMRAFRGPDPIASTTILSKTFVWADGLIPQLIFPDDQFVYVELDALPSFASKLHSTCRNHASYFLGRKLIGSIWQ